MNRRQIRKTNKYKHFFKRLYYVRKKKAGASATRGYGNEEQQSEIEGFFGNEKGTRRFNTWYNHKGNTKKEKLQEFKEERIQDPGQRKNTGQDLRLENRNKVQ